MCSTVIYGGRLKGFSRAPGQRSPLAEGRDGEKDERFFVSTIFDKWKTARAETGKAVHCWPLNDPDENNGMWKAWENTLDAPLLYLFVLIVRIAIAACGFNRETQY